MSGRGSHFVVDLSRMQNSLSYTWSLPKMASRAVYIVAAKRTPFGTFGGKLKGITATDLGKAAASAALKAGKVPAEAVDSVIVGNVAQVRL